MEESVTSKNVPEEQKKEILQDEKGVQVSQFAGLPIESLICGPILAAARGQQELTALYIDGVKKLAYEDESAKKTNQIEFQYERPIIGADKKVTVQKCKVEAPLISLVPVPAFTMDELTVDFDMEVKSTELQDDKSHKDA